MPSLRQKVTTYFRQLSFIAESGSSRDIARRRVNDELKDDDGNFITKYLEGRMVRDFVPGPDIIHGQNPTDMPEIKIGIYDTGPHTITAACTGPDEGLTGIKRSKLHLSASYADDIDFIDTNQEELNDCYAVRKSTKTNIVSASRTASKFARGSINGNRRLSNGADILTTVAGGANGATAATVSVGMRSRKNSKTGIAHLVKETNANKSGQTADNKSTTIVVSMISSSSSSSRTSGTVNVDNDQNNKNLLNATNIEVTKITMNGAQTKNMNTAATITTATVTAQNNDLLGQEKLIETATERLLREAVSNQDGSKDLLDTAIAGVSNWKMENEYAYGISVSLYENNMLTKEPMGNPIADCYGMVVRGDAAAMALADGVNWGDGARLAARSAVHGCLHYLDRAIFGVAQECMASNTQEVFVSLLRGLWEGHGCILEVGGALSTLTVAVVLPLPAIADEDKRYVVCACNVGDSLGYVYSKQHGVREFTQASHDITSMRDMRDALGALGPADGNKPELSNLTFSMTFIECGDIVFLTSDGISDNFDPVVGKFAEAWTSDVKLQRNVLSKPTTSFGLAPKRQNKSASAIYARLHRTEVAPVRPPRNKATTATEAVAATKSAPSRPKYMRSQTVIEPRHPSSATNSVNCQRDSLVQVAQPLPRIPKSATGLPLVTGPQRHALTLYRLEDLLSYGINGTFSPCISARRLCHLLVDFARMITSARRKTLEQRELFYKLITGPDGIKREVELNRMQHRAARKRIVDSSAFTALPGKLDHATVVAYIVGGAVGTGISTNTGRDIGTSTNAKTLQSKEFKETTF